MLVSVKYKALSVSNTSKYNTSKLVNVIVISVYNFILIKLGYSHTDTVVLPLVRSLLPGKATRLTI